MGGARHVVVVTGEAGIGKSPRLPRRPLRRQRRRRPGCCSAGATRRRSSVPAHRRGARRAGGGRTRRPWPGSTTKPGPSWRPSCRCARRAPDARGGPDRARLFGAVTDLVAAGGKERPPLLVLDDLQWADDDTMLLVRHLVRGWRRSRSWWWPSAATTTPIPGTPWPMAFPRWTATGGCQPLAAAGLAEAEVRAAGAPEPRGRRAGTARRLVTGRRVTPSSSPNWALLAAAGGEGDGHPAGRARPGEQPPGPPRHRGGRAAAGGVWRAPASTSTSRATSPGSTTTPCSTPPTPRWRRAWSPKRPPIATVPPRHRAPHARRPASGAAAPCTADWPTPSSAGAPTRTRRARAVLGPPLLGRASLAGDERAVRWAPGLGAGGRAQRTGRGGEAVPPGPRAPAARRRAVEAEVTTELGIATLARATRRAPARWSRAPPWRAGTGVPTCSTGRRWRWPTPPPSAPSCALSPATSLADALAAPAPHVSPNGAHGGNGDEDPSVLHARFWCGTCGWRGQRGATSPRRAAAAPARRHHPADRTGRRRRAPAPGRRAGGARGCRRRPAPRIAAPTSRRWPRNAGRHRGDRRGAGGVGLGGRRARRPWAGRCWPSARWPS